MEYPLLRRGTHYTHLKVWAGVPDNRVTSRVLLITLLVLGYAYSRFVLFLSMHVYTCILPERSHLVLQAGGLF